MRSFVLLALLLSARAQAQPEAPKLVDGEAPTAEPREAMDWSHVGDLTSKAVSGATDFVKTLGANVKSAYDDPMGYAMSVGDGAQQAWAKTKKGTLVATCAGGAIKDLSRTLSKADASFDVASCSGQKSMKAASEELDFKDKLKACCEDQGMKADDGDNTCAKRVNNILWYMVGKIVDACETDWRSKAQNAASSSYTALEHMKHGVLVTKCFASASIDLVGELKRGDGDFDRKTCAGKRTMVEKAKDPPFQAKKQACCDDNADKDDREMCMQKLDDLQRSMFERAADNCESRLFAVIDTVIDRPLAWGTVVFLASLGAFAALIVAGRLKRQQDLSRRKKSTPVPSDDEMDEEKAVE